MANTDWAFGFMPYGKLLRARLYAVIHTPTNNIMHGDAVVAGGVNTLTPKMGYLQAIEDGQVPDGNNGVGLLGAVLECFDENMEPVKYIAKSEAGNGTIAGHVLVADHPDQEFVAREDFDGNAIDLVDGSMNADIISVADCAGNTNTGRSRQLIDSSTAAAGADLNLKLIGPHPADALLVADDTPGDTGDQGCRYLCQLNEHYYGDTIAGIA